MSEKKKLSADEVKEKLGRAKERLAEAKDAVSKFAKENGLKKGEDHSNNEDPKIAKGYKKVKAEMDEAAGRVDKYTSMYKDSKKSSSGVAGVKAKYNYPKEVKTGDDKKKYRAETRAKAKKLGITVDEFLKDVEGNNKKVKALKSEDKPAKKKKKDAPEKKKKKPKDEEEEDEEGEEETEEGDEEEEEDEKEED